jgi:hypothetical protein
MYPHDASGAYHSQHLEIGRNRQRNVADILAVL